MDYITKFAIYFKHFVIFYLQLFKVGSKLDQIQNFLNQNTFLHDNDNDWYPLI